MHHHTSFRRRATRWIAVLLGVVAVTAATSAAEPAASLTLPKVVIALKPDKNPELMLQEKRALEAFLARELGRPAEVVIPLSAATILEGLANGTIDLGYLSATDMVNARTRRIGRLLLAGEFPDGRTAYDSYWVVKKDAPYHSITDLRGRPVAFASKTSTSGFVIPLLDLHTRGLIGEDGNAEAFFGRGHLFFGVGYVSAIERVLAGDAEAAAVSYYVLDKDKHLSAEQRAQLRMLQKQGPVPSHVLAVRASLSDTDAASLRQALVALNAPEHTALRDKLFTTRLVPVDEDAHLAPLAQGLALAARALRQ
jgi:phosphonate transport system substrate-binding protein